MEKLKKEYVEEIKEYEDLLEAEANVKFYKIKLADVPSDISIAQMAIIEELIEEEKK